MAEGEVVVRRLISLATGPSPTHALHSVLLTPTRLETLRDALDRLSPKTPVYLASQPLMDAITGFHIHRGVLAAGFRPSEPALDAVLQSRSPRQTLLVLEDLANHDNIGGIFRNAAAFGAAAVLLSPRCADPLYRKSIRVSAGHALSVPFARLSPWPAALTGLREAGHRLAALVTDVDAAPLADWASSAPERTTLIVGAEGPGLTPAARAHADDLVRIPMAPGVDSLNVGVAAAIVLHALAARPVAAS
jgi:tRNA G18 (ribose-2'-O)-methylase SpoU